MKKTRKYFFISGLIFLEQVYSTVTDFARFLG